MRNEDFILIYYECDGTKRQTNVLEEDKYKNYDYQILTDGNYPTVVIRTDSNISIFSGGSVVILKLPDDRRYELDREFSTGSTRFKYEFNKEGDYVYDSKDGSAKESAHTYSKDELRKYVKMFIDEIIKCEDKKFEYTD